MAPPMGTLARGGGVRGGRPRQRHGDARMHARGGRTLARAGGGCADAGSLHVIGSPSRPRGRALGGSGSCAARGSSEGLARAGASAGDARAGQVPAWETLARPRGAAGQALGAAGPCAGGRSCRSGRVRLRAKRSASRRPPVPRRLPPASTPAPHARPRADPSRRTPASAPTPPCVFNAPLLPKTRLRALFGRQFRILDHSSRSQRAFSPKASVSFRRAVIAVRGLDFGRSGRAVSHEAFVEALRGRPAPSVPCARCLSPCRRYNRHP